MSGKMRIVAKPDCRGGYLHLSRQGHKDVVGQWGRGLWLPTFFGITEPGTYDVTVEKIEPTWPVVQMPNGAMYCGHCGARLRHLMFKCVICGVTMTGQVPQSKVADFLRQDGE